MKHLSLLSNTALMEATAMDQHRSILSVAAHHGLEWTNHMNKLADENLYDLAHERDSLTG